MKNVLSRVGLAVLGALIILLGMFGCCGVPVANRALVPLPPLQDCSKAPLPDGLEVKMCMVEYESGKSQCVYSGEVAGQKCFIVISRATCGSEWNIMGVTCIEPPGVEL